ncbi:short transient receptor potential channel 3-like [Amphiura filiformis]|uniref:short transient receptor potential channel 3-like n=1 Tax=Amphiura filiformis TaxID=82378 RepID=UPI003B227E14
MGISRVELDYIAGLLLEGGAIRLNTTLLRMVEYDNLDAVTYICENREMIEEYGKNIMESPAENDEYTMETTPILLAAEKNNYRIVKILLKYGASMPSYEALKSQYNHLPPTQLTRIIYRYYKAISSEAYLLQTKANLVTDIFNLFKEMKRAKQDKKGMNDEFEILSENLEVVSRKVLDLARNDDEVCCLLAGDKASRSTACVSCTRHDTIPPVIKDALLLNVKGFLAHDKCQAVLTDLWYQSFGIEVQQSNVKKCASAALFTCLYPLLCILYIVFPCGPLRRVMKVPFIKFVHHTASRLTFLGFLIYSSLEMVVTAEDSFDTIESRHNASDEELRNAYLEFRNARLNQIGRICIFLWIMAMTLREVNDIRRMGRKMYLKIGCSITDILQLGFYWIYIVMTLVAIIKAHQTVQSEDFRGTVSPPPTQAGTVTTDNNIVPSMSNPDEKTLRLINPLSNCRSITKTTHFPNSSIWK